MDQMEVVYTGQILVAWRAKGRFQVLVDLGTGSPEVFHSIEDLERFQKDLDFEVSEALFAVKKLAAQAPLLDNEH